MDRRHGWTGILLLGLVSLAACNPGDGKSRGRPERESHTESVLFDAYALVGGFTVDAAGLSGESATACADDPGFPADCTPPVAGPPPLVPLIGGVADNLRMAPCQGGSLSAIEERTAPRATGMAIAVQPRAVPAVSYVEPRCGKAGPPISSADNDEPSPASPTAACACATDPCACG